jgi:hypothetical protein
MTHLTADQFVDAMEGRTGADRGVSAHLAGCERCQAELSSLADVLRDTRAVPIPEPSPLFWDHFARRVRAATSDELVPQGRAMGWLWQHRWQSLAMIAVGACALVLVVVMRSGEPVVPAPPMVAALTPAAGPIEAGSQDDGGLNVVAVVAADLRTEDLQQVAPSADATGAALEDLTPAQCQELMRLIKAQMSGAEE